MEETSEICGQDQEEHIMMTKVFLTFILAMFFGINWARAGRYEVIKIIGNYLYEVGLWGVMISGLLLIWL